MMRARLRAGVVAGLFGLILAIGAFLWVQGHYQESARQICGWPDLYARGIFLDQEAFIGALNRTEYVPLIKEHLRLLLAEQQNQLAE